MLNTNVSEVAETALAAFVLATQPERTLTEAYQDLFDFITPLLKKFDCRILIAKGTEPTSFKLKGKVQKYNVPYHAFLNQHGSYDVDELDRQLRNIKELPSQDLLKPLEILSNLVDVLAKNEEATTERIKEIIMAKNIVEAICKTLVKKPT